MRMAKKIVEEIKKAVTPKKVTKPVTCTVCDGRGLENDHTICHACKGNGVVS
jgi:DnaJ-class molecular chaperone